LPKPSISRTEFLDAFLSRCSTALDDRMRGSQRGAHSLKGQTMLLATLDIQREKVAGLKARRKPLFELYERNPNEIHLVLEIKSIDDEIAACKQQMDYLKKSKN
jgi:hypothetical protein